MKVARFFSAIFAVFGSLLLVGSIGLCLLSLNAPVRVLEMPQGAVDCSDAFAQALNEGDLSGAARMIYGQPDLGAEGTSADGQTAQVWEAFLESISFEYTGKCYAVENGFARDASITVLDPASVTQKLPERTQALVNQRISSAGTLEELYDEDGRFREELVTQILNEALQQSLTQDAHTVTLEVTVKLVDRDGGWWVVPEQALLQALTGLA